MDKPLRIARGNKILTIDESSDAGCGSKRRGDGSSRRQELQEFRSSGVQDSPGSQIVSFQLFDDTELALRLLLPCTRLESACRAAEGFFYSVTPATPELLQLGSQSMRTNALWRCLHFF